MNPAHLVLTSSRELISYLTQLGQLGARSSQFGRVFRSGPVWPGLSGYRAVTADRVGRWGHVHSGSNQGLGKGLGNGFRWEKLPREQLDRIWAVLGGYGRKGPKGQVAIPCPIVRNCPAMAVIGSLSIYTDPWGQFWASISLGKTLKKPCEKEEEREAGDLKRNRLCGA